MVGNIISGTLLALAASASCIPLMPREDGWTAAKIEWIAGGTKSCPDSGQYAYECRTAEQALPYIIKSFVDYGLTTRGEQAAALGIMLFESSEFKYNRNHWPGTPGQGTRNMQMPDFNLKYAQDLFPADKVAAAQSATSDPVVGVLNLLRPEAYCFGSAAWFIKTQCSDEVRSGLQSGTESGWEAYITSCVGTTVTSDRHRYWIRSYRAFTKNL